MDEFLATVGIQAMRYAIRSGIALTSTYALGQCSRLLNSVEDKKLYSRLKTLRKLLDGKIRIISPAIDLIEFKSGRGNVFLESAVPLAKSLHKEIVSLGRRIEIVVGPEELTANPGQPNPLRGRPEDLVAIIKSIEELLSRIDREIPLLQLAISASGESLSTQLPAGVSPSRLLQASTFLIVGDTQFAQDPSRPVQIGPVFTLSLYMLFLGHASSQPPSSNEVSPIGDANDTGSFPQIPNNEVPYGLEEGARKPLWKEVLHKARVRLCRTRADYVFDSIVGYRPDSRDPNGSPDPFSPHLPVAEGDEYAYHLEIIEDLDDGRLHDNDHKHNPSHYDDIATAGIRESIPIHQVSKIFYTDTGRILNIGNATDGEQNPVLLLKRDSQAAPNWNGTGGFAECLEYANSEDGSVTSEMIDGDDEQDSIDKQLMREFVTTKAVSSRTLPQSSLAGYKFPSHLDPEWIALEVFEEDDEESIEDDEDDEDDDTNTIDSEGTDELEDEIPKQGGFSRPWKALDSKVVDQIKRLSLRPSTGSSSQQPLSRSQEAAKTRDFVARSPFGAITTSLSLMEMLIRLTSLQEFQQASHLSIPDHILSFFLEETSTTGLIGETQWRVRNEAKRRVGFDPYTDAPTK